MTTPNEPRMKALQLRGQVNGLSEMVRNIGGFGQISFDRENADDIEAQVELVNEACKEWLKAVRSK